jgi:hypothetical protein
VKQQFKNNKVAVSGGLLCGSAAVVAFFCLVIAAWAGPGYLSTVGPVPLRFLPPAQPLEKVGHRVAAVTPPVTPVISPDETNMLPVPDYLTEPVITEAHSPPKLEQTNLVTGTPPDEGTVSTQMLLQYFGKSTNNSGNSVIVPVNVATPKPVDTPPSRASYTNAP